MTIDDQTGLVLEGGGMRGVFTCGVLDYLVDRLEEEGRIIVIRPQRPVVVGRMEKDIRKLNDLYEEGYACAEAVLG